MGKLERRIGEKLDEWSAAGLLTPAQAVAIREREAQEHPGTPWGIVIFAGFGAVVLGLGVILLFAYNWDQMHKFAKLAVVFGALGLAHGTGGYLRRKGVAGGFAEAAFLLGTMMLGAGIWLVAQIYHISAHYPDGFLVWAVGALLLAWALPAVSQGLLAAVLLTAWGVSEAVLFGHQSVVAPLLVACGTGGLAWRLRSPVLLATATVAFMVTAAVALVFGSGSLFPVLLGIVVLLAGLAWLTRGDPEIPAATAVFRVTGGILYFSLLFILTFHEAVKSVLRYHPWGGYAPWVGEWLPAVLLLAAALAVAGLAIGRAAGQRLCRTPEFLGFLLAPLVLLVAYLALWGSLGLLENGWSARVAVPAMVITANAIYLYHTVVSLWSGCREVRLRRVVGGSLLLAACVLARFADLFDSLLARGAMFLVMGAALFAVAILYHRQKQRTRPDPCTHGKEE